MKDYYKILSIKATASAENIHARWIELMRKFHPDRGIEGEVEDERVREINEAYEVLKHPSSRAHYDLERTYHRKKRNLYLQRVVIPPAILIILLILGLIYFEKPWGTSQPKSQLPSARTSITDVLNGPNALNQPNQTNRIAVARLPIPIKLDTPDKINQTNDPNAPNEPNILNRPKNPNQTNLSPLVIKAKPSRKNRKAVTSSKQRKVTKARNVPNQKNQKNPKSIITAKKSPKIHKSLPSPDAPNDLNVPNPPNALNVLNQTNQPRLAKAETSVEVNKPVSPSTQSKHRNEISKIDQMNQTNVYSHPFVSNRPNPTARTNQIHQFVAQLKEPSLLATEGEVNNFFAEYRERYDRKDIEGFLSLFSSRAVQNGKDGFNEIKRIYSDFFDQSEKLRYHIEDTRIQIYQNAVEVWANYEIEQTSKKTGKEQFWKGDIRWILLREDGDLKVRFLDFRPQESR